MYEHVYATVDRSIASALQAAARSSGFIARDLCTTQRGDGEPAMKRLAAVASPGPDVANPGADVAGPGAGVGHDVAPAGGGGCFELYGFDVLVDEASTSPSRATCAHYRVRSLPRILTLMLALRVNYATPCKRHCRAVVRRVCISSSGCSLLQELKPWVLEVNGQPGIAGGSADDLPVYRPVPSDRFGPLVSSENSMRLPM
jgi:hypothetical protein